MPAKSKKTTRQVSGGLTAAVQKKALAAKKAVTKGNGATKLVKIRTTKVFRRPRTYQPPKNPQYSRRSVPKVDTMDPKNKDKFDPYKIVVSHVGSESAIKNFEDSNTLVLKVALKTTKISIKKAVEKLYNVEVARINTLIRPDGTKKAYVRLTPDHDALDVASRLGFI